MRLVLLVVTVICLGAVLVEVYWIGWAMLQLFKQAPLWVSLVVLACHLATCLGLARLIDKRGHLQEP